MIDLDISDYGPEDAALLEQLISRAYDGPAGERPSFTAAQWDHFHADNPAGPALLVRARHTGRLVGFVSGLPFRFRDRDGRMLTGHQPTAFSVDPAWQRKGLGLRLLNALIDGVAERPGGFTWGFPNRRAVGAALRVGFDLLDTIPTRIHLPRLIGGRVEIQAIGIGELADRIDFPPDAPGLVRDAAYLRWRYEIPGAAGRYRCYRVLTDDGDARLGVVLANHRFRGLPFIVLVDLVSTNAERDYPLALHAARQVHRSRPLYTTSNLSAPGVRLRVPDRFSPRPIFQVHHPKGRALTGDEARSGVVMAGDWMGF